MASTRGRATHTHLLILTLSFVAVAATLAGKAARDALVLSRLDVRHVAAADLATVVAVFVTYALQSAVVKRQGSRRALLLTSGIFAVGDLLLWAFSAAASRPEFIATLYVWFGLQAPFAMAYVSTVIHQSQRGETNLQASAAGTTGANLGWLGGGLALACSAGRFEPTTLLAIAAALTVACPIVSWCLLEDVDEGPERDACARSVRGERKRVPARWTIGLAFATAAVSAIAAFQLKATAGATIASVEGLMHFFGCFNACAAASALLLQAVAPRVLRRLGAPAALMLTPATLAIAALAVLRWETLTVTILQKGCEHALRSSIDRTALDVRYLPLARRDVLQTRSLIDAIVVRLGDAAGTAVVAIGLMFFHASPGRLSIANLVFLALALAAAVGIRREYAAGLLCSVRQALGVSAKPHRELARNRRRHAQLFDGDPARRLAFLRHHTRLGRPSGKPPARRILNRALNLEIVALAVLTHASASPLSDHQLRRERQEAIERIARLLALLFPQRFPCCLAVALSSDDPVIKRPAIDYLGLSLRAPHRHIVARLLARSAETAPAIARAEWLPSTLMLSERAKAL